MENKINNTEYQSAREEYKKEEKQQLIDSFEKDHLRKTHLSKKRINGGAQYFYGLPVMENGKLQGFNMMTYKKISDGSKSFRGHEEPYKDENGNQIFMNIDQYYDFYKEMEQQDERLGTRLQKNKEETNIENRVLDNSKLAEIRKKMAKKIDETLGTKLTQKELPKPLKKIEKAISDKLLGKKRG